MATFKILTDSCADLSPEMAAELDLTMIPLNVNFRGGTFEEHDGTVSVQELYAALRAGEVSTTAAINPDRWGRAIEDLIKAGNDVLVLAFSSGLSTTYQSAVIAAEELKDKYPDRKIIVIDTLCASMGQGLLVWYACQKRDQGMSLEQTAQWVEENKPHLCHWFTVDDLMFLKRGGRISAATALVGTMLSIKPVLHVDDEGHLVNVGKARGRKASLNALVAKFEELGKNWNNETVFISHGDCLEDAEYVANIVKEKYGVKNVVINYIGAVIGSHAGPGTVAFFFLGDHR